MAGTQLQGRVLRCLPDRRVVVQTASGPVTAASHGLTPRPGTPVLVVNPGQGWLVLTW